MAGGEIYVLLILPKPIFAKEGCKKIYLGP